MTRLLLAVAFALMPALQAAAAGNRVSADDAAEIRAVIERQIDALRHDDARGAFALVSPSVQASFGTA